jgi:hypothetical protein
MQNSTLAFRGLCAVLAVAGAVGGAFMPERAHAQAGLLVDDFRLTTLARDVTGPSGLVWDPRGALYVALGGAQSVTNALQLIEPDGTDRSAFASLYANIDAVTLGADGRLYFGVGDVPGTGTVRRVAPPSASRPAGRGVDRCARTTVTARRPRAPQQP